LFLIIRRIHLRFDGNFVDLKFNFIVKDMKTLIEPKKIFFDIFFLIDKNTLVFCEKLSKWGKNV